MTTTAVRFERHGGDYAVRFAYDATLVAIVKAVPACARSWDPARKLWFVAGGYAEQVAHDMAALGYLIVGLKPIGGDQTEWARALFARVGHARAGPVFRSLSRILHPDNGATGDAQLQRELNAARAELQPRGS